MANGYQLAIEAIEEASDLYSVQFAITRERKGKGYVSKYSGKWKIRVMAKVFSDQDFVKAAGEAVVFVYQAHGLLKK